MRSRAHDLIAILVLTVMVAGSCWGIVRLCRWREQQERTRAAEIDRCKAACERR